MIGFWQMLLLLVCVGAVTGVINEVSPFGAVVMPAAGVTMNNSVITDYGQASLNQPTDGSGSFGTILSFGRIMWSVIIAAFAIGWIVKDYMIALGAAPAISWIVAGIVQAPASFIILGGIYEWVTGRNLA